MDLFEDAYAVLTKSYYWQRKQKYNILLILLFHQDFWITTRKPLKQF